ncbi:MAG: alpha/beta hydrolase [Acidimicrobiales bacterium]
MLCADGSGVLSDGNYADLYAEALQLSPIVGQLPGGIFCDTYPGEIDGLPTLDTTGTPPLLVIGNTGDNATPYPDAVKLDELLADSVLLTYDGPGHTITFFDQCVDGIVVDYFIDLVTPAPGTRCGNQSKVGDGWFVPID